MIPIINNKRVGGNLKRSLTTLLISSIFILSGCSSDSSKTPEEQTPQELINPTTGIVVDSVVAGLNYTCSSGTSGVTPTLGEFTCENNDTVSFYLGSNFISEVASQEFMTPLALFGGNEEAALNFAQLLQTLDIDADPSNGIEIDAELLATLGTIDFYSATFGEDIQALLGDVVLVSEVDAQLHLEETFISLNINADGTSPRTVVEEEPEPEPETNSAPTELYIKSAVYDNNRTATTADDKLYIYFNKAIDPASITVDTSSNYDINGTGAIGSASGSDYNDTVFHRHTISQDDGSTGSLEISTQNDTNISMAQNTITDVNGDHPADYNETVVEGFVYIKKTGQTISYQENGHVNASILDDGHYQSGVTPSYTRDDGTNIVTDNLTGLMWQDNESVQKQWLTTTNYNTCSNDTTDPACYDTSGDTAATYCSDLVLGTVSDWRMPTSKELEGLEGIVDYSRINPSIDPTFANFSSNDYWSSTTYEAIKYSAWVVNFYYGYVNLNLKGNNGYVRCVRDGQ